MDAVTCPGWLPTGLYSFGRLLAVVFVLEVVAFGAFARIRRGRNTSRLSTAVRLQARALADLVQLERAPDGQSCPTWDELVARGSLRRIPLDPWNTPLHLVCGEGVRVSSAGPDKLHGTPDDINPTDP